MVGHVAGGGHKVKLFEELSHVVQKQILKIYRCKQRQTQGVGVGTKQHFKTCVPLVKDKN